MLRLIMRILGRRECWWFFRGVMQPALRFRCTVVGINGCMALVLENVLGCSYWELCNALHA